MSLAFEPRGGLIVVPTEVWGPKGSAVVRLALNTGATTSVINTELLESLGYDLRLSRDKNLKLITANGVVEPVTRVNVIRLIALDRRKNGLGVIAHTVPAASGVEGYLGLDFLHGKTLTLNCVRGRAVLEGD